MNGCPKCKRPFNEGNSPSAGECNGTDDDEGLCEAYAKINILRTALQSIGTLAHCIAKSGPATTPTLDVAWSKFMGISAHATSAIFMAKYYK